MPFLPFRPFLFSDNRDLFVAAHENHLQQRKRKMD
jgi:hypothetical protein